MHRCAKCVLPETYPGAQLGSNGICNHCISHQQEELKDEKELLQEFALHRSETKEYDCIVPLSGGRDSCYALWVVTKKYNMRALAVNYDSGFAVEQAKENIINACKNVGADFIFVKSKRNIQKKLLADYLQAHISDGLLEIDKVVCFGCDIGYTGTVYKTAKAKAIPLIIWGDSTSESTAIGRGQLYPPLDKIAQLKRKIRHLLNIKLVWHKLLLHQEFPTRRKWPEIKEIHLFDYLRWDEEVILKTIQAQLDWRAPADAVSTWRFDCKLHEIHRHFWTDLWGFTQADELYSKMIRDGQLSREEALQRLHRENRSIDVQVIKDIFRELHLSEKQIDTIFSYTRQGTAE